MFRPQKEKTGISYLVRAMEDDTLRIMKQTENGTLQTKTESIKRNNESIKRNNESIKRNNGLSEEENVHQIYTPVDMNKKRRKRGIQRNSEVVMIENEDIYESNDDIADDIEETENGITTKADVINEQHGDVVMYENEDLYEGTNSDKDSDTGRHNDILNEEADEITYEDVENTSED